MQYFGSWAAAGAKKEDERSAKRCVRRHLTIEASLMSSHRFKTQVFYVQQKERELEEKRQRYIRVVDAFKSALDLLGD